MHFLLYYVLDYSSICINVRITTSLFLACTVAKFVFLCRILSINCQCHAHHRLQNRNIAILHNFLSKLQWHSIIISVAFLLLSLLHLSCANSQIIFAIIIHFFLNDYLINLCIYHIQLLYKNITNNSMLFSYL